MEANILQLIVVFRGSAHQLENDKMWLLCDASSWYWVILHLLITSHSQTIFREAEKHRRQQSDLEDNRKPTKTTEANRKTTEDNKGSSYLPSVCGFWWHFQRFFEALSFGNVIKNKLFVFWSSLCRCWSESRNQKKRLFKICPSCWYCRSSLVQSDGTLGSP